MMLAGWMPHLPAPELAQFAPSLARDHRVHRCRLCGAPGHIARSCGRMLTAFGRTQHVADWAREFRIDRHTLQGRLARGVPPERALRDRRPT